METERFSVQFGGHHLAYNLTYEGDDVSLSPTLTGVEPLEFESGGESYDPLEDERSTAIGAGGALGESGLTEAEIDGSFDDLLLGPGNDGPFPTEPEGVLVGDLSQDQRKRVTEMLRTRVGDLGATPTGSTTTRSSATRPPTTGGREGRESDGDLRPDPPPRTPAGNPRTGGGGPPRRAGCR